MRAIILSLLDICGCKESGDSLVFASFLTGDALLLIGNHAGGTFAFGKPSRCYAKTHVVNKVAQALGRLYRLAILACAVL